ncbi:hypothetical protein KR018_007045 [Drosophila ironensis]|nr:hypothetical protein KR018_007045 [Drosophila ironensis]
MNEQFVTVEQPVVLMGFGSTGLPQPGGRSRAPPARTLSAGKVILLGLLIGSSLIVLFGFWDVMMLMPARSFDDLAPPRNECLADQLYREVRVLCWVLTAPKNHKTRAVHVLRTWGKRCNKIYFMTSQEDDELPTVLLKKSDRYEVLWGRTKEAFSYLYEHMLDEADWFLKADDDTYVFVENMRYMLYPYSPSTPIFFGFNYKLLGHPKSNESYMSGGSGYVLSREALRRFGEGVNEPDKCWQKDTRSEDVEMGKCLINLGVRPGDSRDAHLRNRFYPVAPFVALLSGDSAIDYWLYRYAFYNNRACMDCLSEYPVAFHYVKSKEMYVYEYFNYQFQLAGRKSQVPERLPKKIRNEDLVIPEGDNAIS